MNWYEFLPPLLSIYLIAISFLSSKYLKHLVESQVGGHSDNTVKFIQNVALDWETRITFFNSMIATIISVFVIYSNAQAYDLAAITVTVILVAFVPMWLWILSHNIGQLAATKISIHRRFSISRAGLCQIVLVLANIVLLISIFISESRATKGGAA